MMVRQFRSVLSTIQIVLVGFCLVTGQAQAQTNGDAMRGADLADSWCKTCHIIDNRSGGVTVDPAPSFPAIANNPNRTTAYLQRWLSTSHPQMPNFNLGRREIVDLIAYIRSLNSAK